MITKHLIQTALEQGLCSVIAEDGCIYFRIKDSKFRIDPEANYESPEAYIAEAPNSDLAHEVFLHLEDLRLVDTSQTWETYCWADFTLQEMVYRDAAPGGFADMSLYIPQYNEVLRCGEGPAGTKPGDVFGDGSSEYLHYERFTADGGFEKIGSGNFSVGEPANKKFSRMGDAVLELVSAAYGKTVPFVELHPWVPLPAPVMPAGFSPVLIYVPDAGCILRVTDDGDGNIQEGPGKMASQGGLSVEEIPVDYDMLIPSSPAYSVPLPMPAKRRYNKLAECAPVVLKHIFDQPAEYTFLHPAMRV